jgi:DNA polymerase-3 subunit epsilon/exodeoxyribonuclease X
MKLLLSKLVKEVKRKYPDINPMKKLVELTKTPVLLQEFKFGKYRGERIADIAKRDIGYLKWAYKSMDLDEDMKFTLGHFIKST